MDQKGMVLFETSRNERKYTLMVPANAQYSEIYDISLEYASMAFEKIKAISTEIEKQRKDIAEQTQEAEAEAKAKAEKENPQVKAAKEDNND